MSIIAQAASTTTGTNYTLIVTSGSGDGVYSSGSVVTITADAPSAGMLFDAWTGATVANASSGSTTITMNANHTVVATYTAAPPATYTLAVVHGTGDGNYEAGHVQAIAADAAPTGQVFDTWTGATVLDAADPTTTLTMPAAAATVTANYVDGPFYALVVNSGSGDGSYLEGDVVTITANAPASGDVFDAWTGDTVADASASSTTITMPASAQAVTATYLTVPSTYTLTVVSGTGGGNFAAATVNPIVANAPSAGHVFSAWTGGGGSVANASASSTTVTMPAAALAVTATYVDGPFFTLTVNSGTGDGSYLVGAVVTIVASAPPSGQVFSAWTGGTVASASSPSTTVTMPASAVTVTATYVNNPVTYTLVVTAGSGDGNYTPGAVVAIVADTPTVGKQFSAWTGGGGAVASPTSASTTVTMPSAALTVTATYIDIPPPAADYYVAKTGSDSNSGTSVGSPFLTINKAASVATAGDTVLVRTGTYLEALNNPTCTGSSGNPLTFAAYPGEVVWMSPVSGSFVVYLNGAQQYLVFDGINFDAQLCTDGAFKVEPSGGHNPHHITITNAELVGPTSGAHLPNIVLFDAQFAGATGGNVLSNCLLLQLGGDDFCHAIYVKSGGNTISGNDISDVPGAGIHLFPTYTATGNQLLNNTIHDLRATTSGQRHWGIIVGSNSVSYTAVDTVITGNDISGVPNDGGSSVGLYDFSGDGSTYHANNVHDCAGVGVRIEIYAVDATLTDNTSEDNTVAQYQNAGTGTTSTGNSWD